MIDMVLLLEGSRVDGSIAQVFSVFDFRDFEVYYVDMPGRIKLTLSILFLSLVWASFEMPLEASAQDETAYDLIYAVNGLRASLGLEPYQVDAWLMSYAQEHSDYQAAMHKSTHEHRDGGLPWQIGIQENVAAGDVGIVTVSVVVYQIWVDWGHRHVLDGYTSGLVGAGIAISDDGTVYYTLDMRPGDDAVTVTPVPGTAVPFVPLVTCTPQPDGSIFHTVREGETLWSIALSYGVRVNDIRNWNGMAADSNYIYVGEKLLVRLIPTATPAQDKAPMEPTSSDTASRLAEPSLAAASLTPAPLEGMPALSAAISPSPLVTASPTNASFLPSDVSGGHKAASTVMLLVIIVLLIIALISLRKMVKAQNE
jgi:LysM repeat protein